MKAKNTLIFLGLCLYGATPVAEAHSLGVYDTGIWGAFLHPFVGIDHLLAMLVVGIWAGQLGGRSIFLVPLSFMAIMLLAVIYSPIGYVLPHKELILASSLLILGLCTARSVRVSSLASSFLVGVFAIFHGYAHASDLQQAESLVQFSVGLGLGTLMLILIGMGFARYTQRYLTVQQLCGYLIATTGIYLFATV